MNQILHPRVGSHVSVAVVPLRGEDALHDLHHFGLGDVAEVVGGAREGRLLVVGAAHATSDHDVEAEVLLAIFGHNNNTSDIVRVNIQRVIAFNSDADLELPGQIPVAVQRLDGVG